MRPELTGTVAAMGKTSFIHKTFQTVGYDDVLWGLLAEELSVPQNTEWSQRAVSGAWAQKVLAPYEALIATQA